MYLPNFKNIEEIAEQYQKKINIKNESQQKYLSGFDGLDAVTNGFQPSNLILIVGPPAMLQTAFAIALIKKMATEKRYSIGLYSFTLSAEQVLFRLLALELNISAEKFQSTNLNDAELELTSLKIKQLKSCDLHISDYPFQTIADIERELSCHPPNFTRVLIIDSLQNIAKCNDDVVGKVLNKKELTNVSFILKQLAEKYKSVIIVFFTFDNKNHFKNDKRPTLQDLKLRAPINSFADVVLLLYRPEYYNLDCWDDNENDPATGQAELIIAKNNNGSLAKIRIKYNYKTECCDNLY